MKAMVLTLLPTPFYRYFVKISEISIKRTPDDIVQNILFVKIAVMIATIPASSFMFSKEIKNWPDLMKSSGAIKADSTAGGT
jgi:hypothetical protein